MQLYNCQSTTTTTATFDESRNLQHHWPFNGNLNDIVSGANLIGASNAGFITDRRGSSSSALNLNNGYLTAPAARYFTGNFTISMWLKPQTQTSAGNYHRLIDFSNGDAKDSIMFCLLNNLTPRPLIAVMNNGGVSSFPISNTLVQTNVWSHLAATLQGTLATLYLNGEVVAQGAQQVPNNVVRRQNFIGRGVNPTSGRTLLTDLDDLRIFNRSLSQAEIQKVLNSYY